jgi:hypothetical protein
MTITNPVVVRNRVILQMKRVVLNKRHFFLTGGVFRIPLIRRVRACTHAANGNGDSPQTACLQARTLRIRVPICGNFVDVNLTGGG